MLHRGHAASRTGCDRRVMKLQSAGRCSCALLLLWPAARPGTDAQFVYVCRFHIECLKVKKGQEMAAAFFESRRYASMLK